MKKKVKNYNEIPISGIIFSKGVEEIKGGLWYYYVAMFLCFFGAFLSLLMPIYLHYLLN